MKNLRFVASVIASSLVATGVVLVACGGDTEATSEQDPEAGTIEAGAETSVVIDDAGTDAPLPPFDAGFKVDDFFANVSDGFCSALSRCCFGSANLEGGAPVDGGTFDRAQCEGVYKDIGFESSNRGRELIDGGQVELDQKAAADCIAVLSSLSCQLTATEFQATRALCFSAYKGRRAIGQPCRGSIECPTTAFCLLSDAGADTAGNVGQCAPLRGVDAGCGDFTSNTAIAQEACSYRFSGTPNLHCDNLTFAPVVAKPRAEWKCVPAVANGEHCAYSHWCASGMCNPDNGLVCTSPLTYFSPSACGTYVNP